MKIKNKRNIILITIILGIIVFFIVYLKVYKPFNKKIENENKVIFNTVEIVQRELPQEFIKTENNDIFQVSSEEVKKISVKLEVLDKNYQLKILEGASVFDSMKNLQKLNENEFFFNYKEYPGLGVFVYEINGIKEEKGKYWIYYVNGKEASVGVSSYYLEEGDSILWKQE